MNPPRKPHVLLINPNTSAEMTTAMQAKAAAHFSRDVEIHGITAASGFPVIATRVSYVMAAHAAITALMQYKQPYDAVILSCFGDPGLEAMREITKAPVIGLAEASILQAMSHGMEFAILTIGYPWIGMLKERVAIAGAGDKCTGIYALDGTGLDVAKDPNAVIEGLNRLTGDAMAAGAKIIILGGGALAGIGHRPRPALKYIDCMAAAVTTVEKSLFAGR